MNLQDKLFRKKDNLIRIHHEERSGIIKLANFIDGLLPTKKQSIVFICIGTDRSTGDSLGPLVGTKLKRRFPNRHIYGTLQSPVHALNLEETLKNIEASYDDPFIIGIDACLGKLSSIGIIAASDGPVKPGAGVNKQLPPVGNMHITGIVNINGFMQHIVLQNTRLHLVMSMADFITESLVLSLRRYHAHSLTKERSSKSSNTV